MLALWFTFSSLDVWIIRWKAFGNEKYDEDELRKLTHNKDIATVLSWGIFFYLVS